jgi:hypothetical protein
VYSRILAASAAEAGDASPPWGKEKLNQHLSIETGVYLRGNFQSGRGAPPDR